MLPGISAEACLFADLGVDPSTPAARATRRPSCSSSRATSIRRRARHLAGRRRSATSRTRPTETRRAFRCSSTICAAGTRPSIRSFSTRRRPMRSAALLSRRCRSPSSRGADLSPMTTLYLEPRPADASPAMDELLGLGAVAATSRRARGAGGGDVALELVERDRSLGTPSSASSGLPFEPQRPRRARATRRRAGSAHRFAPPARPRVAQALASRSPPGVSRELRFGREAHHAGHHVAVLEQVAPEGRPPIGLVVPALAAQEMREIDRGRERAGAVADAVVNRERLGELVLRRARVAREPSRLPRCRPSHARAGPADRAPRGCSCRARQRSAPRRTGRSSRARPRGGRPCVPPRPTRPRPTRASRCSGAIVSSAGSGP